MENMYHHQKDGITPQKRALPEVPMAAASKLSTTRRRSGKPSSDFTAAGLLRDTALDATSEAPDREHPMAAFDNLLEAFEAYIEGRGPGLIASSTSSGTRQQERVTSPQQQPQDHVKRKRRMLGHDRHANGKRRSTSRFIASMASLARTNAGGGGDTHLPRLRSNNHIADPVFAQRSTNNKMFRSRSLEEALAVDLSPRAAESSALDHPCSESPLEAPRYDLEDGPFDVMLRSKSITGRMTSKQRSNLNNVEIGDDPESTNTFRAVGSRHSGNDHPDPALAEIVTIDWSSGSGVAPPPAGIFQISDPGTGFVHYGYSWNVYGAKAEQLLKLEHDTDETGSGWGHPHKGLSSIARWRKRQDGESQTGRQGMRRRVDWLCCEVGLSHQSSSPNQTADLKLRFHCKYSACSYTFLGLKQQQFRAVYTETSPV